MDVKVYGESENSVLSTDARNSTRTPNTRVGYPESMPSRRTLKNRAAIVTGASSGIGRATAAALAAAGCHTILVARNAAELDETARQIEGLRPDRRWVVLPVDITDPSAPETIRRTTLEAFGRIDVLVNNAGINA